MKPWNKHGVAGGIAAGGMEAAFMDTWTRNKSQKTKARGGEAIETEGQGCLGVGLWRAGPGLTAGNASRDSRYGGCFLSKTVRANKKP